jgi:hypothetical protein
MDSFNLKRELEKGINTVRQFHEREELFGLPKTPYPESMTFNKTSNHSSNLSLWLMKSKTTFKNGQLIDLPEEMLNKLRQWYLDGTPDANNFTRNLMKTTQKLQKFVKN